jgi:hypothetical protein
MLLEPSQLLLRLCRAEYRRERGISSQRLRSFLTLTLAGCGALVTLAG